MLHAIASGRSVRQGRKTRVTRASHASPVERMEPRTMLAGDLPYYAEPHAFENIDLTPSDATVLENLSLKDDGTQLIDLEGRSFQFYGHSYSSLWVSLNGLITFDEPAARETFDNDALGAVLPQAAIAPLWDDWVSNTNPASQVLYKFDDANHRLIIEWSSVEHFVTSPSSVTFQAILELNTSARAGDIIFNYPDLSTGDVYEEGASATVGIKAAGDASKLVVSYSAVSADDAPPGESTASELVRSSHAIRVATDNRAPRFISTFPNGYVVIVQVSEGATTAHVGVSATDADGDPIIYSWDLDGDGQYETVSQSVDVDLGILGGPYGLPVAVQITDGLPGHEVQAFALVQILNVAPTAADRNLAATEDTEANIFLLDPAFVSDPGPTDVLGVSFATAPAHGTLTPTGNGTFTYTPDADYFGSDSFTYVVSDGDGGFSSAATVTILVAPVNDAPLGVNDAYTVSEDGVLDVPTPGVLLNDLDVDRDGLSAVLVSGPQHGSLTFNADGSFQYTPALNYNGPDGFTYRASDGVAQSGLVSVDLTVSAVNDAPTAVADQATTDEDGSAAGNVLANDTDVDGAAPANVDLVAGPTRGSVTLDADGGFLYVPLPNFFGTDRFTYVARDAAGEASAVTEVKVTVNEINDAPVIAGESIDTAHDTAVDGNVLVNDTDPDNEDGLLGNEDTLTATLLSGPASGTVVLNADGRFTYSPSAGFSGTDSFRYQVSDGRGGVGEGVAMINVAAGEPEPEPEASVQLEADSTQPGKTALLINGTARGELIAVVQASAGVEVYFGCASVGVFDPTGRIIVHGNGGNDVLFVGPGVQNAAWLYGDDGNDVVKLGHGGGIAFGGAGADLVSGGNGRDILVGGESSDLLVGNPGDDVLISALTTYDDRSAYPAHEDAWSHLYAEWNSSRTFGERVNNLRDGTGPAGRLNGSYFLNDCTINDDAACDAIDILSGSSGSDWFIYKFGEDTVIGMTKIEAQYDLGIS
jgi:hypothetical protein